MTALVRRLHPAVLYPGVFVIAVLISSVALCSLTGCRTAEVHTPAVAVDPVIGASAQWDRGPVLGAQLPKVSLGEVKVGAAELDPVRGVGAPAVAGPSAQDVQAAVAAGVAQGIAAMPAPAASQVVYVPPTPVAATDPIPHESKWGRVVLLLVVLIAAAGVALYVTKRLGRVTDAIGAWFKGIWAKRPGA